MRIWIVLSFLACAACTFSPTIVVVMPENRYPTAAQGSSGSAAPASPARLPLPAWSMRPVPEGEVNLLGMGDWGTDSNRQGEVAETLAQYVAANPTQFNALLLLGDNFYMDLSDQRWRDHFEDMYDASRLAMPFYAMLGNHDYSGSRWRAEMAYSAANPDSRFKLPARWYRLEFPAERPLVTVLVLDSNRAALKSKEWADQRAWLEAELGKPRSKWTIVAAHHTIYSNGSHGDSATLQREWADLFRRYDVDFYLSGHDHSLQHLKPAGHTTSFVVAGGGGRTRTGMHGKQPSEFGQKLYGFAHLRFLPDRAELKLIDGLTGKVVHEQVRPARSGT